MPRNGRVINSLRDISLFCDRLFNTPRSLTTCDILVQVENFLSGGLENAVLGIITALRSDGWVVGLLILGETGSAAKKAEMLGIPVIVKKFEPEQYEKILLQVSPIAVLSNYSPHGADICGKLKIPIIQVIHNVYMWLTDSQKEEFQIADKNTKAYIACSDFAMQYSTKRLGISPEKCVVIPYGIDIEAIKKTNFQKERSELREKIKISDNEFVFVSVAAINYQKNPLGAVRSFHRTLFDCPNSKFVLLGPVYEETLLEEIQKYTKQNALGDRVIYAGASSDAYPYFAMADAFICTSFFEGGPLVLLEALASNLPIVTNRVGFADLFGNQEGVSIVCPPVDIIDYHGGLPELRSTEDFEERFAAEMKNVYFHPTRPGLGPDLLEKMDKKHMYKLYAKYIRHVISGENEAFNLHREESWSRNYL
jgi:glycosyltransferase involved in cell wall biosynthesis